MTTPFRLGPSSASGLPGMARAQQRHQKKAAPTQEGDAHALPPAYKSRRRSRWLWRWRPAWAPLLVGAALGMWLWERWPVAATVTGVWLVVWRSTPPLWRRSKIRRVGLAFRHRWDETMRDLRAHAPDGDVFGPGQMPALRHQRKGRFGPIVGRAVTVHPYGEIIASVLLPPRLQSQRVAHGDALQETIERGLRLPGGFGYPEWSLVYPKAMNASAWREVRVAYRGAPDVVPWGFRPAPNDSSLRLGCSAQGENVVDLLEVPHLRIYGPPRAGKGQAARDLAGQACSAGWLVLIVNSSGAPEWNPWSRHQVPNVEVVRCSLRDPQRSAYQFAAAMDKLIDLAEARDRLCDQHRVDAWAQLPDWVRAQHPRVLCLIDEPSALLKTAGRPGKHAGGRLEVAVRTSPKYGIVIAVLDQIVNVSGSAITGPTIGQMRGWVWVGEQPSNADRDRIGGFVDWPTAPLGKGGAVYARFGTPRSAQPVRMPYHSPEALEAFLASQRKLWP